MVLFHLGAGLIMPVYRASPFEVHCAGMTTFADPVQKSKLKAGTGARLYNRQLNPEDQKEPTLAEQRQDALRHGVGQRKYGSIGLDQNLSSS